MKEEAEFLLGLLALRYESFYAFTVVFKVAHLREVEVNHNFTREAWTVSLPQIVDDLVPLHSYVERSDSFVNCWVVPDDLTVDLLQDWVTTIDLHVKLLD